MIIYHNPRCAKSREALNLLVKKKIKMEIKEYLKNTPTVSELKEIITMLGCKPKDIIRTKEKLFQDEYKNKNLSDAQWIQVLVKNPILIERPIIISGNKAIVARPPELITDFLKGLK